MNLITRGQSNTVIFTLTERATLSAPYFLVRAKSRRTNEIKKFILDTNTGATERYDRFTITESTTEDLTNSTVTLTAGDWWYTIYEQSSATNLNTDLTTTLLEEGIFRVLDTNDTYIYNESQETYIV